MTNKRRPNKTLVFIVGPTGSGKTDLAVELARYYGTSIVSADSRQLYRGLEIGSAQPSKEQLDEVKHYFIGDRDITDEYSAGQYADDAVKLLDDLFSEKEIVIAVGGSGLYIDALCRGLDDIPEADQSIRDELTEEADNRGLGHLLERLEALDPVFYRSVDRDNPRRVIRALEVCISAGKPYSSFRQNSPASRNFNIIKIGTELPRDTLYERIDLRVDMMIASGLEMEAVKMLSNRNLTSLQTVGYRELFEYFDGKIDMDKAISLIKRNSRRYAKRQMTWFRRDTSIKWFSPTDLRGITTYINSETELFTDKNI